MGLGGAMDRTAECFSQAGGCDLYSGGLPKRLSSIGSFIPCGSMDRL